jgi:tetratricopeptide (TPR) repeat protein
MTRATLLAMLLAASTAQASVWDHAIESGTPQQAAQDKYDAEMRLGDEHALAASSNSASLKELKNQLQQAVTAYRAAADARPHEGEPYFRIGALLFSVYFDCTDRQSRLTGSLLCDSTGRTFDRKHAQEVIAAWDAFEQRTPLDPRLSVGAFGDNEILFERAILHTKLASKSDLESAAKDYEKILARRDGDDGADRVLGNLAETYMMLDRMEEALDTYREALRGASDTGTVYGYAVALDRDEQSRQALDVIKSLGPDQRNAFYLAVASGGTFFVPEGEKFYYFALADEAFDFVDEAIDNWNRYIRSGAHPEFQPRAKAHLDELMKHKKRKSIPIEPPWPELFR